MHSPPSISHQSRNRLWFLAALIIVFITWMVIQTAQAASIYIIDAGGGFYSDVEVVSGWPVISYYGGSQDLMVAACQDPACTSPAIITAIDTAGIVGSYNAITVVAGNPVIAYADSTNSDLKVAACTNSSCTAAIITTADAA